MRVPEWFDHLVEDMLPGVLKIGTRYYYKIDENRYVEVQVRYLGEKYIMDVRRVALTFIPKDALPRGVELILGHSVTPSLIERHSKCVLKDGFYYIVTDDLGDTYVIERHRVWTAYFNTLDGYVARCIRDIMRTVKDCDLQPYDPGVLGENIELALRAGVATFEDLLMRGRNNNSVVITLLQPAYFVNRKQMGCL